MSARPVPSGPHMLHRPLGTGVLPMAATRVVYRVEKVDVLGPIRFEPGMVRVRHADGRVSRTFADWLTPCPVVEGRAACAN